jgi:hypothetical protein
MTFNSIYHLLTIYTFLIFSPSRIKDKVHVAGRIQVLSSEKEQYHVLEVSDRSAIQPAGEIS